MIRKKVSLFGSALREIGEASTSSATFTTLIPLQIRAATPQHYESIARGIRMLLRVTTRTTNDGTPLSLNVFLEEQDQAGVWWPVTGSTMTPVVTATAFEVLEIYPGVDVTTAPPRRSFNLPGSVRAVAKLSGSITATPGMTFQLDAELLD